MSTTFQISQELMIALDLDSKIQTRAQIETAVIEYVKERNLIDSENKMVYHTDGLLEWLMDGKKVTSAFSAFRDLKDHIYNEIDASTESYEEDEQEDSSSTDIEEEEEEEEEQEKSLVWHRELTVQNAEGKTLDFKFIRNHSSARMSIHGFEMEHEDFMDYYVRLTGENPWDDSSALNLLWLFFCVGGLTMFSLWLSLYNQSFQAMTGC